MNASGPLVARWRTLERAPVEAGTLQHATVEVENAGSATWRTRGADEGLFLAFHWLDELVSSSAWTLEYAVSINDAGQIVGWGGLDRVPHAFLLTPR